MLPFCVWLFSGCLFSNGVGQACCGGGTTGALFALLVHLDDGFGVLVRLLLLTRDERVELEDTHHTCVGASTRDDELAAHMLFSCCCLQTISVHRTEVYYFFSVSRIQFMTWLRRAPDTSALHIPYS